MILHVFNSGGVAGIESLVLPALAQLGLPVRALFLDERRKSPAAGQALAFAAQHDVKAERIAVHARVDTAALRALGARIAQLTPAIVHAHDVKASTYALAAAQLVPRNRRPALVTTHHGVAGRPNALARAYEAFYTRVVLPRYDRVLCCSREDERNLRARGVPSGRLLLHWNGVDGERTEPHERAKATRAIRRAWNVRENGFILGAVGRLSREKGHDRMLEVAAALDRLAPALDWRLLCFGAGGLGDALAARTRTLALDHRVTWMGFRPHVGREMAGFDLLLSLSDAEGMPLNVIEAGWAATPVLATAVGGVVDLLGDPPAGWLVPPSARPAAIARAIAVLLDARAARADLGRRLQQRVLAGFTRAAWIDRLRAIYSPLLEARGMHGFLTVRDATETNCPGDSLR